MADHPARWKSRVRSESDCGERLVRNEEATQATGLAEHGSVGKRCALGTSYRPYLIGGVHLQGSRIGGRSRR